MSRQVTAPARTLGTLAARGALALAALQAVVASGIVVFDYVRRFRRKGTARFPHRPPMDGELGHNTTRLYTYGQDLYADMLASIEQARHTIFLETFIWKGDATGQRFKRALIDAAERGVEVFVIYDGFANLVVPRSFYDFPPSVRVLRFPIFRPGLLVLNVRHSGRDHRKILVVDDEVGYVGGFNIGTLYATTWRDTHLRVVGPAAWDLRNAFVDFWNAARPGGLPMLPDPGSDVWDPSIRVARNAPAHLLFPIRGIYLAAIDRARSHIFITQAYFIPDHEILHALLAAARRGVDVRVIVPEYSNHVITDWLSRGFYSTLLRGGVTIWLFKHAMVHAKTATIDGQWTTIGTANIDRLSLSGNYEINLEIVDQPLARQMEQVFLTDLSNCREMTIDEWERRSWIARFSESVLAPLRPLL
jgi:cardiolipin synthase